MRIWSMDVFTKLGLIKEAQRTLIQMQEKDFALYYETMCSIVNLIGKPLSVAGVN